MENNSIIQNLFIRYPALEICRVSIEETFVALVDAYHKQKKVLIAGNGGSAADSDHIVGELMKGFCKKRPIPDVLVQKMQGQVPDSLLDKYKKKLQTPLEAISLVSHSALITAFSNDVDVDLIFAQQVLGYGKEGDILLVFSTSGNSKNIIHATYIGKVLGLKTIAFTGKDGGQIKDIADISIMVPVQETLEVQEYHLPIYHALCKGVEEEFFEQ